MNNIKTQKQCPQGFVLFYFFKVEHLIIMKYERMWSKASLPGVAQWVECGTVNKKVTGSIPSQSTCLGCRPGPQCGVHERQLHSDVSLPLFLSPLSFV